ncbi:aldehyde dehydrogenase family protein [Rhodanobacter sp. AS-Z3]|uniref:aldehyde dehydrogenase family protein n=1 Tax=Rhodanobacter sp. AS-Z3 TaxID=3031330 RepID=UPI00247990C4|nr:aldehyde dehydrogenase family protein [Rhodanobacter sp. AS-Z3]WEN15031.1 aldehyde dehydrogenase family protein [Rhodanobacter sp. AS-Z3]
MDVQPSLIGGEWRAPESACKSFRAVDPSTGEAIGPAFPVNSALELEAALASASAVADELAAAPVARIAAFLDAYAHAIENDAATLVALAHAETALPGETRLAGVELPRTCRQLRLAAQAARDYSWTHPVIDTGGGLRSHYAPLHKPVLIFGPNNFPFAFNAVAGSDFASAIAARNPVIAKAHPSHPATSQRLAQLAHRALQHAQLPSAAVQLLYQFDSALGLQLAGDARLGAIGFTGSRHGGLALKAAADRAGIPAYMEMSSVNPVFMLPGALAERGEQLAQEFFASCTMGSGQFCTNPGLLVVPDGAAGDAFVGNALTLFAGAAPGVLFSRGVLEQLDASVTALRDWGAVCLTGASSAGLGYRYRPTLLQVSARAFLKNPRELQREAFGPTSLLVRARDTEEMLAVAASFEGNLTGTLYSANDGTDDAALAPLARALRPKVGRLIMNRMPTGVAVSPAMNHGGPYPSTSQAGFTAVGMPAAVRRFAALHCYDHVTDTLLPAELRDRNPANIARLVDGHWRDDDLATAGSATA